MTDAVYLVFDLLEWIHNAKVHTFAHPTYSYISECAAGFWLYSLIFSLGSGACRSLSIRKRILGPSRPGATAEKETERKAVLSQLLREQHAIRRQLVQDTIDLILPASSLGYLHFNDGILGMAGLVTSIMEGRKQWKAVNWTSK